MEIRPIASGSAGNCYLINDGSVRYLIDCGIPLKKIQEGLWERGTQMSEISFCLVSHSHGDHVKSAQALANMGVDVYASAETVKAANLTGHRVHHFAVQDGDYKNLLIDNAVWVRPLAVEHDVPGTCAFLISRKGSEETLLYITDTMYFKYKVDGVTHLMIEANYDPEIIAGNVQNGRVDGFRAKRTLNTHMSIETALLTVQRMNTSALKEVWLLHLSNDNAGADFKRRMQCKAGVEVYVA